MKDSLTRRRSCKRGRCDSSCGASTRAPELARKLAPHAETPEAH